MREVAARAYAPGEAEGRAFVLQQALSFWGGVDAESGRIIDRAHPDLGGAVTGAVLVMPGGRGSSSSSAVLAETIRLGTAPAAIVLAAADPILTVGALVAEALYDRRCPIVVCPTELFATGDRLQVSADADGAAVVRIR